MLEVGQCYHGDTSCIEVQHCPIGHSPSVLVQVQLPRCPQADSMSLEQKMVGGLQSSVLWAEWEVLEIEED